MTVGELRNILRGVPAHYKVKLAIWDEANDESMVEDAAEVGKGYNPWDRNELIIHAYVNGEEEEEDDHSDDDYDRYKEEHGW